MVTITETTLSWPEVLAGATVGVTRHIASLQRNLPDKHGFAGDGWGAHIEGACGEMAYCKISGRYWAATVNGFRRLGDVGQIEVKTRSKHWYELIIRDDDDPKRIFVLMTGQAPTFCYRGWIIGADAMQPQWRQSHGNREEAWFVPQSSLRNEPITGV